MNLLKNINKNAYFLCHGGLGDLFINSGAIRFLSFFYNKIYLFCPLSTVKNLKILFTDINIEFITYEKWYELYNTNNSWANISDDWYNIAAPILSRILNTEFSSFDWEQYINCYTDLSFITNKEGAWEHWISFGKKEGRKYFELKSYNLFDWEQYIKYYYDVSFITNKEGAWTHWISYGKREGRKYFEYDTDFSNDVFITGFVGQSLIENYVSLETRNNHNNFKPFKQITHDGLINYCNQLIKSNLNVPLIMIEHFYKEIGLDLYIYINYFHIPSTQESKNYYNQIKNYKIVFLHFTSSCGETIIPDNEWSHIYGKDYLIINPDKNHYNSEKCLVKYELANKCLNLLVVDYIDIILNATDIYVCDSCFFNIIYPSRIKNELKAANIIIYDRFYPNKSENHFPINLSYTRTDTISYLAGGRLGDFIFEISIINEIYIKTGKKGRLYLSDPENWFRTGLIETYKDTYEVIFKQDYIETYEIYQNQPIDINLNAWRSNIGLYNWYFNFKAQYYVEWGKNKWINTVNNEKFNNKVLINTTHYRWPFHIDFLKLYNKYKGNLMFIASDEEQHRIFKERTGLDIELYKPNNFNELCIAISSCKLFVASQSAPMCIAFALHKQTIIGECLEENHHTHGNFFISGLDSIFSNIKINEII